MAVYRASLGLYAQDLFETQGETSAGKLPCKDRPLLNRVRHG